MQKNKSVNGNLLPTVLALTAVSSCLMFGIIGTYRLTAGAKKQAEQNVVTETESTVQSVETDHPLS